MTKYQTWEEILLNGWQQKLFTLNLNANRQLGLENLVTKQVNLQWGPIWSESLGKVKYQPRRRAKWNKQLEVKS